MRRRHTAVPLVAHRNTDAPVTIDTRLKAPPPSTDPSVSTSVLLSLLEVP